ncbi:MAG: LbtU family siderophore porin, partial [Thiohalomonadales bacterium]
TIGQQYLPFGFFATNLVSDPLTLALGEISDSAITVTYQNVVNIAVYAFKGEVILAEDVPPRDNNINNQKIANFGINFGYIFTAKDITLDFGIGYINSIAEANRLTDIINLGPTSLPPDEPGTNGAGIENFIGGIASHLFIVWNNYSFIVEHIFATDSFAAQEIKLGKPAKPSALNIEMALSINTAMTFAVGVQQTVDSIGLDLPETRVLVGLSYALGESSQIAVELLRDFDYSAKNGGTSSEATAILVNVSAGF